MKSQGSFQIFQVSSEALPESENKPEIYLLRPRPSLLQLILVLHQILLRQPSCLHMNTVKQYAN